MSNVASDGIRATFEFQMLRHFTHAISSL